MDNPLADNDRSYQGLPLATAGRKPLLSVEFDGLMAAVGPFEQNPILAVALSGGPDSMALTLLLQDWAARRNGRVIGLTVDHGLRPSSAEEARRAGRWLRSLGIEHHILTWSGPKPRTGVQQRARDARYDHLSNWCRKAGVLHLLTAHHRQDQAETVALRIAKGSGPDGLAAMSAIRDLPRLRLIRPLLRIDKERLIATLEDAGQPWIDDPSNKSRSFTRNRLRLDGIDVPALSERAADHSRGRNSSDKRISVLLARLVTIDPLGFARISAGHFGDLSSEVSARLLARVLTTIGGAPYPPRRDSLERLVSRMRDERPFRDMTLAHCQIRQRRGQWLLCRENDRRPALELTPQHWHCWEDRFLIRLRGRRRAVFVHRLGDQAWSKRKYLVQHGQERDIPAVIRESLPAIWQDGALIAIPHLGLFERTLGPTVLDLKFRPRTPLANAPFAAHM